MTAVCFSLRRTIALLAWGAMAGAAFGADPFYVGQWKIASAMVAAWLSERNPDPAEMKRLVGRTIVIRAHAIEGPREVACSHPRYRVKEYPADMLFEGAFGEMHLRDASVDPAKAAAAVGFRGIRWKTLQTGCEIELEYHFMDQSTAAFGLNNYIYILKKQR